ncbi:MAG TPA: DUF4337 family protein [Rhizomicrobium sp.]|nr:DUF4337 family protein [Rhizomicrobium sp.]
MSAVPRTPKFKAFVDRISARMDAQGAEVPGWVKRVAILTGLLAAISGFLAVRSTILTNDAVYASGQAILAQTQSSDDWAEYQADSVKARIVETALLTSTTNHDALAKQAADLRQRQPPLKAAAISKAADRDRFLAHSTHILAERDWLGYANFIAQIGIALASVAALLKERRIFIAGAVAGAAASVIVVYAYVLHFGTAP